MAGVWPPLRTSRSGAAEKVAPASHGLSDGMTTPTCSPPAADRTGRFKAAAYRARARGPTMKTGWRARRRRCALLLTTVRRTNRSSHRSFLAAVWHAARRRVEVACPRALRPGCCVACFPPHCCGHVRSTAGWRCRNGMRCDALRTCVGARV
jgi:hypothetical protein